MKENIEKLLQNLADYYYNEEPNWTSYKERVATDIIKIVSEEIKIEYDSKISKAILILAYGDTKEVLETINEFSPPTKQ